jgi:3-hydroxyacyl-CoA dehydrogenase
MAELIQHAAVIGAGVMGAGIAAQLANAGVPVLLLDLKAGIAQGALDKLRQAEPAAFMHRGAARLVTAGALDDHLPALSGCDWIIEAVVEKAEVKRTLYGRLATVKRPGAVLSSNTSTIPLSVLQQGMAEGMAEDFLITHFFNPPRYMRLLEVVAGPRTRPEALERLCTFADHRLGKTVIAAKDTPGFIANRIGVYWLQSAVFHAVELGLTVEEADALLGAPAGIPKTGVFGLLDLVGLDLIPAVTASMVGALPAADPLHAVIRDVPVIRRLIETGYTGRKGKGGFYRRGPGGKEAVDLVTGDWRPAIKPHLAVPAGDLRALLSAADRHGRYAWTVLGGTLAYAASLVPEISDSVTAVDEAMRLGYNWRWGPFELLDRLEPAWVVERLRESGWPVPPLLERVGNGRFYRTEAGRLQVFGAEGYQDVTRPDGVLLLRDAKRLGMPVARNGSAALWDIGDGVLCLEFTSKMNAIDPDILGMVRQAVALRPAGLVIHNEGENFSVGANIGLALFAANIGLWPEIERMVAEGQDTYRAMREAPFPVVGAPSGLALGGGCEILLHCDAIQADAETYMGLVETSVGVVPAWGGCKELLRRLQASPRLPHGPMPAVTKAFETIALATVAKSAFEARDLGFLAPADGITMNRDRLLADAKARVLALAHDYHPPKAAEYRLPGPAGRVALMLVVDSLRKAGKATPHDAVVAGRLATVLSGGDTDVTEVVGEDRMLALERAAFMALIRTPATLARIEAMLETGKPLRN